MTLVVGITGVPIAVRLTSGGGGTSRSLSESAFDLSESLSVVTGLSEVFADFFFGSEGKMSTVVDVVADVVVEPVVVMGRTGGADGADFLAAIGSPEARF